MNKKIPNQRKLPIKSAYGFPLVLPLAHRLVLFFIIFPWVSASELDSVWQLDLRSRQRIEKVELSMLAQLNLAPLTACFVNFLSLE